MFRLATRINRKPAPTGSTRTGSFARRITINVLEWKEENERVLENRRISNEWKEGECTQRRTYTYTHPTLDPSSRIILELVSVHLIYSAETGEQAAAIFVIPQSFTVFGICKIRGFALYEMSETISTSEKGFSGARVCSRECGQTIWL